MLEMKLATMAQLREIYERDLRASFPSSERKPLREMEQELARGDYRPWCLFDGEEIVGEAFVWTHAPGCALLDYLCITPARRNGGLGAILLEKLADTESENVIFWESEIPRYAQDPAMAERRLAFYRRCGAAMADYDVCEFGVPYHTLYLSRRPVNSTALLAAHEATYRSSIPPRIYDACIRIPWEPSMGIPEQTPWIGGEEES